MKKGKGVNMYNSTDIHAAAVEVLVFHQRVRPPLGICSCGHEVQLGRAFPEHQADMILEALKRGSE